MIYVTQGHEKSISLEIFLKSCLQLSNSQVQKLTLICDQETLKTHLEIVQYDYILKDDSLHFYNLELKCLFIDSSKNKTQSQLAIEKGIGTCTSSDILLTLPTSKDQLLLKNQNCAGHTEFFRKYFSAEDLCMVFRDDSCFHLLLTDHIPLSKVEDTCSPEYILRKVGLTLNELEKINQRPKLIYFTGINPHAGEEGVLGNDHLVFEKALTVLRQNFPDVHFYGPFSGDTMHTLQIKNNDTLIVYAHHDQALAPFKQKNKFWGSNMTLGLPFLRLSVDHGTAFGLYGKNRANPLGCFDNLIYALKVHG